MSFTRVIGVSKRFGRTKAVVDVSFEVESGSIFGLVGPNGAGKSTLLRMLATLMPPDSGRILVNDVDALRRPLQARRRIGYVPDVYNLYGETKAWEYLDFFGRCYGLRRRVRHAAIAELLKLVDLFDFRFAYCRSLSRGMQQKLLIARSLLHDPELLILDEPLAGLDAQSRLEMLEVLKELGSMGKAVVISSHALADLVDVSDRIGLMARGCMTSTGTVPELVRQLELGQRVRVMVLDREEEARDMLSQMPYIDDVEMTGHSLAFTCSGGRTLLADVLRQLVQAGISVTQFAGLAQPLEDLLAAAPKTEASPEQSEP